MGRLPQLKIQERQDSFRVSIVVVFLILTTLLAVFLLTPVLNSLLIPVIYRRFLPPLGEFTRLNPYAVKVVAGFLTFGALWVARKMFSGHSNRNEDSGLLSLLPRLDGDRFYRGVLFFFGLAVVVNGLYWAGTHDENFDRNGEYLRFYTIRPDGSIDYHYQDGIDEKSGLPRRPVTAEMLPTLEAYARGTFYRIDDPADPDLVWFDRLGNPLIYYYRPEADGAFEFWSGPGAHPVYQDPISPVSKEIRQEWEKWRAEKLESTTTPSGQSVPNDDSPRSGEGALLSAEKTFPSIPDEAPPCETTPDENTHGKVLVTFGEVSLSRSPSSSPTTEKDLQADLRAAADRLERERAELVEKSFAAARQSPGTGVSRANYTYDTRWLNLSVIYNRTASPMETWYLDGHGIWQHRYIQPRTCLFIALGDQPIRFRWRSRGRVLETKLPSNKVYPPFPALDSQATKARAAASEFYVSANRDTLIRPTRY